jgi:ELP3 family radical SAM enzyme/protein acetyltransferase
MINNNVIQDLEDITDNKSIKLNRNSIIPLHQYDTIYKMTLDLVNADFSKSINNISNKSEASIFNNHFINLRRKYNISPKKSQIYYIYRKELYKKNIIKNPILEKHLITAKMRSQSGVLVISVIMPPDNFSCTYNCYYCPNDPTYSRSYYKGEPTVQRGEQNNFDAYKQFYSRAITYFINGHDIDKVELIILGGTFSCYDPKLSENFIKELYYAANTVFEDQISLRDCQLLQDEIKINENSLCKIIGLTIETRPDKISKYELRRFRKYGVTRIQLGVQHTDDNILNIVNRQCNQQEIIQAIKLAKDNGFKIDIHIMPDLPGSSPEIDYKMFQTIICNPYYQADQWKIYPTNVLEMTEIKKWRDNGSYKPYAETDFKGFLQLLVYVMKNIPPWIRVNRVQRDFPGNYIEGGNKLTNLRQVLDAELKKQNIQSNDIRSMEVKFNYEHVHKARIVRTDFESSDGCEIFLSHKSCTCTFCWNYFFYIITSFILSLFGFNNIYFYGCGNENIIYSFLRLRFSSPNYDNCFAQSFRTKAKIRELHVYGQKTTTSEKHETHIQHHGLGKSLMHCAEKIAKQHKCDGMCVIAGVGTRNYYKKLGYEIPYDEPNHGMFMSKSF